MRNGFRWLALGVVTQSIACRSLPADLVSEGDLAAPLAARVDTVGPHRVLISRLADSPAAEHLLQIAEATYPPRDSVLAAARQLTSADSVARDLWWSTTFDGVRQPYAITTAAVRYYTALSDELRRSASAGMDVFLKHSSFEYRATIERTVSINVAGTAYRDVYVARLTLHWKGYCGDMCAQEVVKERTVILSSRGRVLAVTGDEAPLVLVSAVESPGFLLASVRGAPPAGKR